MRRGDIFGRKPEERKRHKDVTLQSSSEIPLKSNLWILATDAAPRSSPSCL